MTLFISSFCVTNPQTLKSRSLTLLRYTTHNYRLLHITSVKGRPSVMIKAAYIIYIMCVSCVVWIKWCMYVRKLIETLTPKYGRSTLNLPRVPCILNGAKVRKEWKARKKGADTQNTPLNVIPSMLHYHLSSYHQQITSYLIPVI